MRLDLCLLSLLEVIFLIRTVKLNLMCNIQSIDHYGSGRKKRKDKREGWKEIYLSVGLSYENFITYSP